MRILVLAGETADLGPRSTLLGLCRALRASVPELELRSTLADETDFDPPPPIRGFLATSAAARRSHLVLVTNDAVAAPTLRSAAMVQSINRTRALTAGVALVDEPARSHTAHWLMTRSLRNLGIITAADEHAARTLSALGVGVPDVLPDPALLVPAAFAEVARSALAAAGAPCDDSPLIGVVPRHTGLQGRTREESDERLASVLGRVLDLTIERHGAFIVFLPAAPGDLALCSAVANALRSPRRCIAPILDPATFKGIASELGLIVSWHRRAALLATSVGRPTIGLGTSTALAAALERAGSGHAFLDASLFLRGSLVVQLSELIDSALELRRTQVVRFEELRASIRAGIRSLLEMLD